MDAAQQIRRYLDEQGGRVRVPAYHLLTSWDADSFSDENRVEIEHALARAGVYCDPPLGAVREDKQITLFTSERASGGLWQRLRG